MDHPRRTHLIRCPPHAYPHSGRQPVWREDLKAIADKGADLADVVQWTGQFISLPPLTQYLAESGASKTTCVMRMMCKLT